MPVCKNRFQKFARIFSRRHKQATFLDAGFHVILRVKNSAIERGSIHFLILRLLLKIAKLGTCIKIQGPVVQSVVSLTNSLRVISLSVLADSIF